MMKAVSLIYKTFHDRLSVCMKIPKRIISTIANFKRKDDFLRKKKFKRKHFNEINLSRKYLDEILYY